MMISRVLNHFLNSVSDFIGVVGDVGCDCNPALFLLSALTAVAFTSFTTKPLVILTSFIASLALLGITKRLRRASKMVVPAVLYVTLFSIIALTPFLLEGRAYLYLTYLLRALGATLLLLSAVSVLGWGGLGDALRALGAPAVARLVTTHVRLTSTLIKDASRTLMSREARTFGKPGLRDLPVYATAIGDLMLRSYGRGVMVGRAVEARTLGDATPSRSNTSLRLTAADFIMVSTAAAVTVMQFLTGFSFG